MARTERFESAATRTERREAVAADDASTSERRSEVEAAQAAVAEASRVLAEAEAKANAATARAEEERQTRLQDWGKLVLADYENDQQEARAALSKARNEFRAAAPTADAGAAYLRLVAAIVALMGVHQRATEAAARLGREAAYIPERSSQIPTYTDALNQALAAHAAGIQADQQDALSAEIQAVEAGA